MVLPRRSSRVGPDDREWAFSIACRRAGYALRARPVKYEKFLEQPASADGYYVGRNFYFLGQSLRHGGLGNDWVLRLFRRQKGHFKPVKVHRNASK